MSQYWKESGVKIERLNYANLSCYDSAIEFRSCLAGIDHLGGLQEPSVRIIPQSLLNDPDILQGEIVKKIGGFALVRDIGRGQAVLNQESLEKRKIEIQKLRTEEVNMYNRIVIANFVGINPYAIDFAAISRDFLQKIQVNPRYQEDLAMIAGENENSMFRVLDAHARIIPRAYIEDLEKSVDRNFVGIGVVTQNMNGRPVVMDMMDGGPAKASRLFKKNDVILAIDAADTLNLSDAKIISKVRGPEGSKVKLLIQRQEEQIAIEVVRGKIEVKNVEVKMLSDFSDKAVGYIKLRSFSDSKSCEKVEEAIQLLEKQNARSLILDLRKNGGGLVEQAKCVAGLFVGSEPVLGVRNLLSGIDIESINIEYEQPLDSNGYEDAVKKTDLPVVVLIDARSASASEIVAGALQDLKRGWIVGEASFGKATVQRVSNMFRDGQSLYKVATIQRFYLPSGRTNQGVGIQPDIVVPFKPGATENERFALRELDMYPNALPPLGQIWKQSRVEEVEKIETCVSVKKLAENKFSKIKDQDEDADYQVLMAQEILSCQ